MAEVTRLVKELFEECLTRESTSPNAALKTLPDNTDDTIKLAKDNSRLNSRTIDDNTPLSSTFDDIQRHQCDTSHVYVSTNKTEIGLPDTPQSNLQKISATYPQSFISQIEISQTGTSQSDVFINANVIPESKLTDLPQQYEHIFAYESTDLDRITTEAQYDTRHQRINKTQNQLQSQVIVNIRNKDIDDIAQIARISPLDPYYLRIQSFDPGVCGGSRPLDITSTYSKNLCTHRPLVLRIVYLYLDII